MNPPFKRMGTPQTHPLNGWVDLNVTNACPLAWGNKIKIPKSFEVLKDRSHK
jgi:hypothetical protein